MATDIQTRRLFFALWPDDQARQSINEAFSTVFVPDNCRVIRPENVHMTLHFVGQVTYESKDCLHRAALAINNQPFLINLDCFGSFKKAKIFWMGCQGLPVELAQLHKNLGLSLANCDYQSEPREYKPHVTLMRKCVIAVNSAEDFVIPWFVDEFSLVESISDSHGVNYQVIEKYPLVHR